MGFPETRGRAKTLLNRYVSGDSGPPPAVFLDRLLDCAKRFGFDLDSMVFSYLLNSYVRANRIGDAVDCFNRMVEVEIYASVEYVNIVMTALVRRNMFEEARELYGTMLGRGVGDCATLNVMMRACLKEGKPEAAEEYFRKARGRGIAADAALGLFVRVLIRVWLWRDMKSCCELFSELLEVGLSPNTGVYTSMICDFRNVNNMEAAIELHQKMITEGIPCDVKTYIALINGLLRKGDLQSASDLYSKMLSKGITPDINTYTVLINGLCCKRQLEKARKTLEYMNRRRMTARVHIYTALIVGHFK
ncbi:pentatricopeptide repeat-containing protein At3g54980, mitochondrial [Rosa chinensis]|nr:pentatricopeptide repeat-containing protein At3g54980, mitochondrial [Rosa chinensis]